MATLEEALEAIAVIYEGSLLESDCRARMGAALSAARHLGWVLVPVEPTQEMLEAAWAEALAESADGVWREMVATAPKIGEQ